MKKKLKLKSKVPALPKKLKQIAAENEKVRRKNDRIEKALNFSKKKTPKMKRSVPKWDPLDIDEQAFDYAEINEELRTKTEKVENLKTDIKQQAEVHGSTKGKIRIVKGKNWEVGYTMAEMEPLFNPRSAKIVLSPHLYDAIYPEVKERRFNKNKLESLIALGTISVPDAKRFLTERPPQKRIYVSRIQP